MPEYGAAKFKKYLVSTAEGMFLNCEMSQTKPDSILNPYKSGQLRLLFEKVHLLPGQRILAAALAAHIRTLRVIELFVARIFGTFIIHFGHKFPHLLIALIAA